MGIDSVDNTNFISSDVSEEDLRSDNSQSNILSDDLVSPDASSGDSLADNTVNNNENPDNTNEDTEAISTNTETSAENPMDLVSTSNEENVVGFLDESTDVDNTLQLSRHKTDFTISKSSILRGTTLYIYLKDGEGNPIAGKNVTLTINNVKYTKTTNNKGAVSLYFGVLLGNYTLKAQFKGDSEHNAKTSSFLLNIYQIKTKITVHKVSVPRGKYLYAYLKDIHGNPLSNRKLTIRINGKDYIKTTNAKGKISLKISHIAGKYPAKISYSGCKSYCKSHNAFTLHVYRQATNITVASTSVIRGKCLYAYLKTSTGKALKSKRVIIRFNNIDFYRTTDENGKVGLRIKTKLGTFPTKIIYSGSGYYKPSVKSIKLKSYVAKTRITVANASVVRGKYLYAYLKDSSNKAASNQKLVITFKGKKYSKTTDSKGKIMFRITEVPKDYSIKIRYDGSNSYKPSNKTLTIHVKSNATAKIIAKDQTGLGEYSVRLTDIKGNPLANQTLKIITSTYNRLAGSGKKLTQKTIIIDSDNIFNPTKDKKFMNDLATALRAKGYKVIVSGIDPNTHCDDVKGKYSDAIVLCLFGGADSGMFKDMSDDWYQNLLKKYNNRVVLGFLDPPNTVNLATCTWLKRAHDDKYSPSSFTGLSYPGTYLNQHGMDYIYGKNATQMANNFINYAVKGLSIGLDNTIPCEVKTYYVKTNENGYATLYDLKSGTYTVQISYSNTALGYVADTVKTKITIL